MIRNIRYGKGFLKLNWLLKSTKTVDVLKIIVNILSRTGV
jgi:hypothetical protein